MHLWIQMALKPVMKRLLKSMRCPLTHAYKDIWVVYEWSTASKTFIHRTWGNSVNMTRLRDGRPAFDSQQGRVSLFVIKPRLTQGPTKPPIRRAPRTVSRQQNRRGREDDYSPAYVFMVACLITTTDNFTFQAQFLAAIRYVWMLQIMNAFSMKLNSGYWNAYLTAYFKPHATIYPTCLRIENNVGSTDSYKTAVNSRYLLIRKESAKLTAESVQTLGTVKESAM